MGGREGRQSLLNTVLLGIKAAAHFTDSIFCRNREEWRGAQTRKKSVFVRITSTIQWCAAKIKTVP